MCEISTRLFILETKVRPQKGDGERVEVRLSGSKGEDEEDEASSIIMFEDGIGVVQLMVN